MAYDPAEMGKGEGFMPATEPAPRALLDRMEVLAKEEGYDEVFIVVGKRRVLVGSPPTAHVRMACTILYLELITKNLLRLLRTNRQDGLVQ